MKRQFIPFIFSAITAGLLLSSCGNLSKISFTKRHYRSGYYVDFGHKNNTATTTQSTVRMPVKTKYQTSSVKIANQSSRVTATILKTSKTAEANFIQSQKINQTKKVKNIEPLHSNISPPTIFTNTSTSAYHSSESESEVHARVDVDVSMVVIVLCAIFIPPLGVALMYGLNSYFWIDLILTLLFFFPGMIFALIVVLM